MRFCLLAAACWILACSKPATSAKPAPASSIEVSVDGKSTVMLNLEDLRKRPTLASVVSVDATEWVAITAWNPNRSFAVDSPAKTRLGRTATLYLDEAGAPALGFFLDDPQLAAELQPRGGEPQPNFTGIDRVNVIVTAPPEAHQAEAKPPDLALPNGSVRPMPLEREGPKKSRAGRHVEHSLAEALRRVYDQPFAAVSLTSRQGHTTRISWDDLQRERPQWSLRKSGRGWYHAYPKGKKGSGKRPGEIRELTKIEIH